MATQSEVDAITAELGTVATDLASGQVTLQAEIDSLAAANPAVDVTALKEAADALDPAVQKLASLVPDPATTTPVDPTNPDPAPPLS
jgi:hypothetical protein